MVVVGDDDVELAPRRASALDSAWANYVSMRESGALDSLIRLHQQEREAEHRRADEEDAQWRLSRQQAVWVP